jgi:DNA-binding CsgD family transcriptional regulator/uncharacterized membrane protein
LVCASLLGGHGAPLTYIVSICSRAIVNLFLWLILALLALRSKWHPFVVFGFGWALYMFATASGIVVTHVFGLSEVMPDELVLYLIYVLVVSTILILGVKKYSKKLFHEDGENATDMPADYWSIADRCRLLGIEYSLTKREIDVMEMLCKGRSKSYIAKELKLSENTVRGYSQNLYQKLSIHSKQELLNIIEAHVSEAQSK